jgi:class 3 adenylate cyclase
MSTVRERQTTYELVKGKFPTRELGDVTVKGKTQPVKIYGVVPASVRKHQRAPLAAAATRPSPEVSGRARDAPTARSSR